MITYSIGEVAKRMGITTHTLRYYEKEGLLPRIRKNSSGARRFNDGDLLWLKILESLKATGLSLKDIKYYLELKLQGDKTLSERKQIFLKQKERLEEQIKALGDCIEKVNFKIKYCETAIQTGEDKVFENNQELQSEGERLFSSFK